MFLCRALSPFFGDNDNGRIKTMHANTKIPPRLRKEIYCKWQKGVYSLRSLAAEYHVDKRVIQRIAERGERGDFSVHSTMNKKYLKGQKRKKS